jgi:hypothetical protein
MATIHRPFKYVPALHTDVAKTIKREQMRLKALEEEAKRKAGSDSVARLKLLPQSKAHSTPG